MLPMTSTAARIATHCGVSENQAKAAARKLQYVVKEFESAF